MKAFRSLRADEVDCRVAQVKSNGITALLYKDARCDMRILDETVGPENWQREHYECKGNLFCRVGINVGEEDRPVWVWKSDCGTESNTEKEKGEASDSFKRACFNWGIGRELYTAPFIWIPSAAYKSVERNGKTYPDIRLKVTAMTVEDGKITALEIYDEKSKAVVFSWGGARKTQGQPTTKQDSERPLPACADCHERIVDDFTKNGEPWPAENIAIYSQRRYGVALCPDCMRKRESAKRSNA